MKLVKHSSGYYIKHGKWNVVNLHSPFWIHIPNRWIFSFSAYTVKGVWVDPDGNTKNLKELKVHCGLRRKVDGEWRRVTGYTLFDRLIPYWLPI